MRCGGARRAIDAHLGAGQRRFQSVAQCLHMRRVGGKCGSPACGGSTEAADTHHIFRAGTQPGFLPAAD